MSLLSSAIVVVPSPGTWTCTLGIFGLVVLDVDVLSLSDSALSCTCNGDCDRTIVLKYANEPFGSYGTNQSLSN